MKKPSVVGKNIKKLRKRRGWTQKKLALKAKLSRPAISMLESGYRKHPRMSTIESLAKAFRVTIFTFYRA